MPPTVFAGRLSYFVSLIIVRRSGAARCWSRKEVGRKGKEGDRGTKGIHGHTLALNETVVPLAMLSMFRHVRSHGMI